MPSFTECELLHHAKSARAFAQPQTRDATRADDLAQPCLERALSRAHQFEAGTNLQVWLFTICRGLFLKELWRASNRLETEVFDAGTPYSTVDADQETQVYAREAGRAFRRLSDKERSVVNLVCIQGLEYEEAAVRRDIPVGTVRSRLVDHLADPTVQTSAVA